LKVTVTISVVNAGAAVQQAMDANAEMASVPIDPTAQLPDLSAVANTASQLDFRSVLERLDGFMKVADLAAEVCWCLSAILQRLDYQICTFHDAGPPVGQISMGCCISSI
jgi:hypothetical protein